jgi:translocation and assembly module TamB
MQIEGANPLAIYARANQPPLGSAHGRICAATLKTSCPFTVPHHRADDLGHRRASLLTLTKNSGRWIGKARITNFDLRAWGAGGALGRITGDLALAGNRDGFRARGALDSAGLAAGPFDALFEGNWVRGALRADRIQLVHQQSRSAVEAKGEIRVVENGPRLELAGDWSQLRWPLAGAAPAIVRSGGKFTFSGVWPYALVADGQFESPDLGETIPFSMSGQLAKTGLTISTGSAKLYDGTAQLRGQVDWSPAETWQLAGTMRGLNPGRLRSALPGSIGFDFDLRGDAFGPEANLDAQFRNLQGRLRGAAARGRGRIQRQGQGEDLRWLFEGINVAAGGLRLAADGWLSDASYNLDFRLDADDLGVISEQSRGALTARGTLGGTLREPLLRGTASGRGIELEGIQLGALDADIDFDPRAGKTSNVRIEARKLEAFGRSASQLDFPRCAGPGGAALPWTLGRPPQPNGATADFAPRRRGFASGDLAWCLA